MRYDRQWRWLILCLSLRCSSHGQKSTVRRYIVHSAADLTTLCFDGQAIIYSQLRPLLQESVIFSNKKSTYKISMAYLVTGASSGIGLELVKQLAEKDEKVFATVRKKASSLTGIDEVSAVKGDVTVIEGIDVSSDDVGSVLISALKSAAAAAGGDGAVADPIKIHTVIHNAGSLNGTRDVASSEVMSEQKLDVVTTDRMRAAFEVNTLGPLRVQQALLRADLMESPGGKIAIISTGLASIADNTSGGNYAYRTSKAAVNMVAKCLSCDVKEKGISVMSIAPGFVATEFGPGKEKMEAWGAMPVDRSCKGIIQLIHSMSMDNTGKFFIVNEDGTTKEFPW